MSTTDRDALLIRLYLDAYLAGAGATTSSGSMWDKHDKRQHYAVALGVSHGRGGGAPLSRSAVLETVARLCGEERPRALPSRDLAEAIAEPADADVAEAHLDGQAAGRAEVLDALEKFAKLEADGFEDDGDAAKVLRHLAWFIAEQRKPAAATHRAHDGVLHAGTGEGCGMCEVGDG